jgi:hypothetical protein
MKLIKNVTREVPVVYDTICDSCGNSVNFKETHHAISEVNISYVHGSDYGPDGGNKTTESVDFCPSCFMNKLKPWLVENKIQIHTEESSW